MVSNALRCERVMIGLATDGSHLADLFTVTSSSDPTLKDQGILTWPQWQADSEVEMSRLSL